MAAPHVRNLRTGECEGPPGFSFLGSEIPLAECWGPAGCSRVYHRPRGGQDRKSREDSRQIQVSTLQPLRTVGPVIFLVKLTFTEGVGVIEFRENEFQVRPAYPLEG